jgi:hypothetical protein
MPLTLGVGDKIMSLPREVQCRLQARAVTDLDLASLLAIFTKSDETASKPPDQVVQDAETPKL